MKVMITGYRIHLVAILSVIAVLIVFPSRALAQEDLSDFSRTFQVFQQSSDAYRLYDLAPDEVVYSLPPSYTLGPGDILQVILSGMVNDGMIVQVAPQGDIYVPPAGLMKVEGLTVREARELIDEGLSRYIINYECSLQLMKARRIKVYLIGQVRQPGSYVALAGTTTVSLIQTAGSLVVNPSTYPFEEPAISHPYFRALTSGAGRWAEIYRNDERVGRVDLAAVATGGRTEGDIVLEDGDAIYILPNNNPVIVRGGVSRPGTYEIRQNDTVFDVLQQAGGYQSMMMLSDVHIERENPDETGADTVLLTLNLADPDFNPGEFRFEPGDTLRVPEVKSKVYVLGAVWAPQAVDYHEGWNALDYIAEVGGPSAATDINDIRIISCPLEDDQTETIFQLKNLYLGESVETVPIEPGDMIWVPWDNQPFYGPGLTNSISVILGQTVSFLRILEEI